jgi:hypothetical protein
MAGMAMVDGFFVLAAHVICLLDLVRADAFSRGVIGIGLCSLIR